MFDRYAIVDGHYWWNIDHHGGQSSKEYARMCNISRYFTPAHSACGPEGDVGKEIYNALCEKACCTHAPLDYQEEETEDLSCNQCQALMINGRYCHETGCPNTRKIKVDGEWITPEEED